MLKPISQKNMNKDTIASKQNAILSGINFLHKRQLSYGEFQTLKSSDVFMQSSSPCYCSSPYITTFILYCLSFIKEDYLVNKMIEKSLIFLQEEMEMPGVWRFYTRENRKIVYLNGQFRKINIGIVPDFDDTACVSYVLKSNGIYFPDNTSLFYENKSPNGVFYTWFLDDKDLIREGDYIPVYNNICCGVNANILLYLGDRKETHDACNYINNVIANDQELTESAYFPDPLVVYYLISRAYASGMLNLDYARRCIEKKIINYLEKCESCEIMKIILVMASLLNFGQFKIGFGKWVDLIVESQNDDGSWPAASFFIDTNHHYGSKELTTAIALEVLCKCKTFCW